MDVEKLQNMNKLASDMKKYNLTQKDVCPPDSDKFKELEREVRNLRFGIKRNEERIVKIMDKMNEMIREFNDIKRTPPIEVKKPKVQRDQSKPMDCNGVAPEEVSIHKFFNFSKK